MQLGDYWTPWLQSQDLCQRSPVLQLPALEGDSWFWLVDIIVHSLLIGCYISILISDWYNIKRSLIGWYNLILISDWLKVGCWPGGSWILETQRWHHQLQSLQQEVWLHRQDSSLQSLWRGVLLSLLKYSQIVLVKYFSIKYFLVKIIRDQCLTEAGVTKQWGFANIVTQSPTMVSWNLLVPILSPMRSRWERLWEY